MEQQQVGPMDKVGKHKVGIPMWTNYNQNAFNIYSLYIWNSCLDSPENSRWQQKQDLSLFYHYIDAQQIVLKIGC